MSINIHPFKDLTVAVLGLGKSGLAAAKALVASGAVVWAWDDGQAAREHAEAAGVPIVDLSVCDWTLTTALVLSPGIPHTYPEPNSIVAGAKAAGVSVIGDVELLARACPEAKYVGITGTNGKSTTTALIGHIVEACGVDNEVGGNLGPPPLDFRPLGADGVYVLEMSSYQLELTHSLKFDVAVLLNISPDHLDRHGGMNGYMQAKMRIFNGAQTRIVGIDDAIATKVRDDVKGDSISGLHAMDGIYCIDGVLFDHGDRVVTLHDHVALQGSHNGQNTAAAYAACRALGLQKDAIVSAIKTFPGLAHRQEHLGTVDGVTFINDSKATNVDAAKRALSSFDDIHWIVGGLAKEGGLRGVEPELSHVTHAYLIGEATDDFAGFLGGQVATTACGTIEAAVNAAFANAKSDAKDNRGVVVLSPACASFDQYPNFEARGEAFRKAVLALSES